MEVISKPSILLQFFLQANIARFQILYKDFLKGILHVVKKDEKTSFLEQNESKNEKNR